MKTLALMTLVGLTPLVNTTPIPPSPTLPLETRQGNGTSSAPCAQVSQYLYGDDSSVPKLQVPAGLAFDCISSVPFNATSGRHLITAIRPYVEWQSTLTQLKNPPAEYVEKVQAPVDIIAGLDDIISGIDAGRFKSEYDFGWSLYTLIQSAHDGHFSYIPDIVGDIFNWGRPIPLVSVSEDGQQLPAVFVFADVIGAQYKNISYTPSPVVEIDGMAVSDWLDDWSQVGSLQDRDALYNNVFYSLAQVSLAGNGGGTGTFTGGGRGRLAFPGDSTTLKFANGTEYTMQNYARAIVNFRNVNSGEDLARKRIIYGMYDHGLEGPEARVKSLKTDDTIRIVQTAALSIAGGTSPGYPPAVVPGPGNLINGFFIDSPGYEDVAVLQIPNFVGSSSAEIGFQRTTQEFIPKALAAGKTKLIIDLQANGGGTILQGYDLFKQLFPTKDPYGADRFRAIEDLDLIGKAYSSVASSGPRQTGGNYSVQDAQTSWFDYHTDMTVEGKPFSSWAEKFGPQEVNGDKYTSLTRWNLSDILVPFFSGGINITGYGPLANVTGPPKFEPENIVVVTDGYCASTCTIFAELLTKQAGVKTIAMGGRSNKNQIQAIGGVKGTNSWGYSYIQVAAQTAVRYDKSLNNSVLREHYDDDLPFLRSSSAGVNTRDGLRQNDTSGIALQFIYEEANCRLYYTPEMTVDITAIWKSASDAQWGNSGKCVSAGGYGQKRNVNEVSTKLGRRRVQVAQATAMRQVQALENSFSLETECQLNGDGFMKP
jgi:hypothetical protein